MTGIFAQPREHLWAIGTAQTVGLTLSSGTRVAMAAPWAGPRLGWQQPAEPRGQPEGPHCPRDPQVGYAWLQHLGSQCSGRPVLGDLYQESLCNMAEPLGC